MINNIQDLWNETFMKEKIGILQETRKAHVYAQILEASLPLFRIHLFLL